MKINFVIDPENDIEILLKFAKQDYESRAGFNIFKRLITNAQELEIVSKLGENEREDKIRAFVLKKFKEDKKLIEDKKKEVEEMFSKIKDSFLKSSSKLFDDFKWAEGEYTATFTVWYSYPRVIEKKLIYIPYKSAMNETIRVAIHELLHIMFFNYFEANFKGRLTKELAWDLSEILNVILMNLPEINNFTNIEEKAFPNHKERCEHLKNVYSSCSSMKEFMEKAIDYLNSQGDKYHELGWVDRA